jgi:hypothetical protein
MFTLFLEVHYKREYVHFLGVGGTEKEQITYLKNVSELSLAGVKAMGKKETEEQKLCQ